MRRWVPFPFIRFFCFFSIGILLGIFFPGFYGLAIVALLGFAGTYLVLWRLSEKQFSPYASVLGLAGLACLIAVGYLHAVAFYHQKPAGSLMPTDYEDSDYYEAEVVEAPKEGEKYTKLTLNVHSVKKEKRWERLSGRVIVYLANGSKNDLKIRFGDRIVLKAVLKAIKPPKNPADFNYKRFLKYQNITHSAFIKRDQVTLVGQSNQGVFYWANKIQSHGSGIISKFIDDKDARSIVHALVFGKKDTLENQLKSAYANAGVIHILAVSGLHVGIIYSILLFLFSFFEQRKSKWLFLIISLFTLWSFAFITGLSPSVCRAATMFSFIIVAEFSKRQTNIYNTLAASAFLILCFNPYLIMSVGFQLSYFAVLGIVYLYPKLYPVLSFDGFVADKIWKLMCVSLAAQFAVLPLSVYYFNQVPTYFLFANLVMIPAAFVILSLGLFLLLIHPLDYLAEFFGKILEILMVCLNEFVYLMSALPVSIIGGLYINTLQLFLLIALIAAVLAFFKLKKLPLVVMAILLLLAFQAVYFNRKISNYDRKELVYFSLNKSGVLTFLDQNSVYTIRTGGTGLKEDDFNYHLKPYLISNGYDADYGMRENSSNKLVRERFKYGHLVVWNGLSILVINSPLRKRQESDLKVAVDLIVLENDAVGNLETLKNQYLFKDILIGNSYSYKMAKKLKADAEVAKLKIYNPREEGAFFLNL